MKVGAGKDVAVCSCWSGGSRACLGPGWERVLWGVGSVLFHSDVLALELCL